MRVRLSIYFLCKFIRNVVAILNSVDSFMKKENTELSQVKICYGNQNIVKCRAYRTLLSTEIVLLLAALIYGKQISDTYT